LASTDARNLQNARQTCVKIAQCCSAAAMSTTIAVRDRMFLRMQDLDFAQILQFIQILLKFCPNLPPKIC